MALKLSRDDLRIVRAAIMAQLDGDTDEWDDLSGDDLDRAQSLTEEITSTLDGGDEDDEDDEDDDDPGADADDALSWRAGDEGDDS